MSCSGFRFARELDALRADPNKLGTIRLIRGAVLNTWETYGIHLLEAVLSTLNARVKAVTPLSAQHPSLALTLNDGTLFQLDALGQVPKVFQLDMFGSAVHAQVHLADNFSAFRRTLWHFMEMVRTGQPTIPPHETLHLMHVLQAGRRALTEGQTISVPSATEEVHFESARFAAAQ